MESRIGVKVAGMTLALGLATGLSACSSVPDWVDPTTWIGGSDKSASDDSGLSKEGQQAEQSPAPAPDLADVPAKPAASDEAQNANVESSLAADRASANYSADALRGGTEAAAPPPPASAPTDQQVAEVSATPSAVPAAADDDNAAPPASDAAPAAPAQPAAAAPPSSDQVSSVPGTLPDEAAPAAAPAPAPVAAAPAAPAEPATAAPPPETQVASNEPAPAAAPAMAAPVASPPPAATTDTLGFAPSSAPPLDPSVGQFVSSGVVNRYQQTQMASVAPVYGYSSFTAGSVGARAAIVTFAGDKTVLDDKGRGLVKAAADAFRARGGAGFVRVVGHASSRSENVSAERHLELDFDHSQARATAVAQALIRAGVPAEKVLVEAVGDSGPVRAMGDNTDRSAEIFIQG